MLVFGPVPSRRLGRSLGINNIPRKVCTYDCVYCQVGKTKVPTVKRREFFKPSVILNEVKEKLKEVEVDYITFVPDGEPTLDVNLGKVIKMLKGLGKIAVISNGSLLHSREVRNDLMEADLVSIKIDAVTEDVWRRINQPCRELDFERVKEGMLIFSKEYRGILITETMLVSGFNDSKEEIERIASFISKLSPSHAYISIPMRPPSYENVHPAPEETIDFAYMAFTSRSIDTTILSRPEAGEFIVGENWEDDLLSITSVHPMRERDVLRTIGKFGKTKDDLKRLVDSKKLERIEYRGEIFYRKR